MTEGPLHERELKFPHADHEALRRRLRELGGERVSASSLEDNRVFDRSDELRSAGCVLRLRKDGHGERVTFKGPARFEGGLKIRLEHETPVENGEMLSRIFEELGYHSVRRYQKFREEWRLNGVVVALDRTPIGDFAEFEGEAAEQVAAQCGYRVDAAESRSYLRLYEDYRRDHPESPEQMVFP